MAIHGGIEGDSDSLEEVTQEEVNLRHARVVADGAERVLRVSDRHAMS